MDQITMPLVIGTDEAGYAPNLGPLVVSATAWQAPNRVFDFYTELAEEVHTEIVDGDPRLVIADSKIAYRAGGSLDRLETAVLTLLGTCGLVPRRISELLAEVCCSPVTIPDWYAWTHDRLPLAARLEGISRHRDVLSQRFSDKSLSLRRIVARLVFPDEFNSLVEQLGNKAAVLSAITLQLVAELLNSSHEDCLIVCDRHGGRARYAPLVQQFLAPQWIQVDGETPTCSRYSWSTDGRKVEIHFQVGGESFLPTAAASMTAKYLREIMMAGWNEFWLRHDTELRPTAGYPGDASRFLHDVRPVMTRLGIGRESIWRSR
jgi:ribonuclease HII